MSTAAKISLTAALCLAGLIAAFALRQDDLSDGVIWLPRCTLHSVTGLHCPSCGNTRAAKALLNGDLVGAFRQNPAFVIALPFLALGALRLWIAWVFPALLRPLPFTWRYAYSVALIGLVVLFGVVRNIPVEPFTFLAPEPVKKPTVGET